MRTKNWWAFLIGAVASNGAVEAASSYGLTNDPGFFWSCVIGFGTGLLCEAMCVDPRVDSLDDE